MRNPVQHYLESLATHGRDAGGEVADYIPELAAADPESFALSLTTVDGHIYTIGQADTAFSIQSISKPFTYALALHDQGSEAVAQKIDVEPSGEAFNRISLDPRTNRPSNPMINAGAITAASLVAGSNPDERFDRVSEWFSGFAGRQLHCDTAVYESEIHSAHRNRAIAHMLREFGVLDGNPEEFLDQYIRQCSISVTTEDLSMMAATLANGGLNPVTEHRAAQAADVEQVLSVMTSCGMYDAAGDWLTSVGVPAKSGVSGGIIGVLPGQLGLAVFSPRLDLHGHSARGVRLFERISADMELHLMHVIRNSNTAIRDTYTLAERTSLRRRPDSHQRLLDTFGDQCQIYALQGDLHFSGVESIARRVVDDAPDFAVLDLGDVNDVAQISSRTLLGIAESIRAEGGVAILVDPDELIRPQAADPEGIPIMGDLESAMRWCEDELLRRHGVEDDESEQGAEEHPLLRHMPERARRYMRDHFERLTFQPNDIILQSGNEFSGVHIITAGEAIAEFDYDYPEETTTVTMTVGTSFGELALAHEDVQQARVRASTEVTLLKFSAEALNKVSESRPAIAVDIWRAMTRDAYRVADRALQEAAANR